MISRKKYAKNKYDFIVFMWGLMVSSVIPGTDPESSKK